MLLDLVHYIVIHRTESIYIIYGLILIAAAGIPYRLQTHVRDNVMLRKEYHSGRRTQ